MKDFTAILLQRTPYLDSTRNRLILIGFVGLFSLAFLLVYVPFNINQWGKSLIHEYILLGSAILLTTQFGVRRLLKLNNFKLYSLVLFGVFEILLISYVFHLMYLPELEAFSEKWDDFLTSVRQVGLVTVVPYVLVLIYFWVIEKVNKVTELENKIDISKQGSNSMLVIKGENDKIILAIKYGQLLYIKSAGNYLELYCKKGEKVVRELVRSSLKELEDKIEDSSIIRIHRSYMVNIAHLASVKKTRKGYSLSVKHMPEETLTVSSGYRENFKAHLPN
ncbi:LytR/AlgR family response regulator transcription factor [Flagellimonas onchidii]|uniref:LytR/AlgR family response regulator transcription factor n=1 Tax=Flagellimonas onchidii TaxID=2562684 RepID=UPI0010A5F2C9|nr:LytTR family DNA-binding domain-containing protein [Allomuricauda onchidii]